MQRYVCTIPLSPSVNQVHYLNKVMEAGRVVYNTCLNECQKRKNLFFRNPNYRQAKKLDIKRDDLTAWIKKKSSIKDPKLISLLKQRDQLMDKAKIESGYYLRSSKTFNMTNSLEVWAQDNIHSSCWMSNFIKSHARNDLMDRAFKAVKAKGSAWRKSKDGRDLPPRVKFRRFGEFNTISGKSATSNPKWDIKLNDGMILNGFKIFINKNAIDSYTANVLSDINKYKFCRLTRRKQGEKFRFYAQLIMEGSAPKKKKNKLGKGSVGFDFGTQTLAYFLPKKHGVIHVSNEIKGLERLVREQKLLQRKIDRQRRANNPDNYDEKGRIKTGRLSWIISKRQKVSQNKLAERHRKIAETRKCLHGKIANELRSNADVLHREDVSYKAWQKSWGKSLGKSGIGSLSKAIDDKFVNTGGSVEKINIRLALSQICPGCGNKKKKSLKERLHKCEICGKIAHRDVVSALLAYNVKNNTLHVQNAKKHFEGIGQPLAGDL